MSHTLLYSGMVRMLHGLTSPKQPASSLPNSLPYTLAHKKDLSPGNLDSSPYMTYIHTFLLVNRCVCSSTHPAASCSATPVANPACTMHACCLRQVGEIPLAPEEAAVGLDIRVVGNDSGEKVREGVGKCGGCKRGSDSDEGTDILPFTGTLNFCCCAHLLNSSCSAACQLLARSF